ncbi:MAG: Crp/Fnr family transcriptional regulator [Candidatus Latescibacteria bacterium]|jgi:CRP/FNR family transcriptional regulator|nr:Crp/Fnr family transcriptional regulator [Candidatus Latescibacterota bacterium]
MMGERLTSVITLIEEVAFRRVDSRIAEYLANSINGSTEIRTTHQKIAADLGTSREVVSRILKDFEHQGWISLSRNAIQVNNVGALAPAH